MVSKKFGICIVPKFNWQNGSTVVVSFDAIISANGFAMNVLDFVLFSIKNSFVNSIDICDVKFIPVELTAASVFRPSSRITSTLTQTALIQDANAKNAGKKRRWRNWAKRGCLTVAYRSSDNINKLIVLAATGMDCATRKRKKEKNNKTKLNLSFHLLNGIKSHNCSYSTENRDILSLLKFNVAFKNIDCESPMHENDTIATTTYFPNLKHHSMNAMKEGMPSMKRKKCVEKKRIEKFVEWKETNYLIVFTNERRKRKKQK